MRAQRAAMIGQAGVSKLALASDEEVRTKSVIVADSLPKTSTGKIQKNRLRDDHKSHYEG